MLLKPKNIIESFNTIPIKKDVKSFPSFENTVKTLDSFTGRSINQLQGSLRENIFYLHIFKCGGTSINQAIKACYLTWNITKDRYLFYLAANASFDTVQRCTDLYPDTPEDYRIWKYRESLLLYYMYQGVLRYGKFTGGHYISGHFSFSECAYQNFCNNYAFITVLRDPVKRWISGYFFNRYKQREHHKIDLDLKEYLNSERAQKESYYVKLLGGVNKEEDYRSEQAIARAKENLHKFRIVGCLEYQEDFIRQFEEQFGRRLKIRNFNPSPKSKAHCRSVITEEIEEKIKEICKPDIEIYQYAVENLVKKN